MYSTARAILRRPRPDDLDRIRQLESDPDVVCWTPMRTPRTVEQSRQRLENQIRANYGESLFGYWLAETRDGGEFIGWFMLIEQTPACPTIGFMLVKPMWKKGYAREISACLIQTVLRETTSQQILATADRENAASHRVLQGLGFEVTGSEIQKDKISGTEFPIRHYRLSRSQA